MGCILKSSSGILTCIFENNPSPARMRFEERCDIKHFAMHYNPTILLLDVFTNLMPTVGRHRQGMERTELNNINRFSL